MTIVAVMQPTFAPFQVRRQLAFQTTELGNLLPYSVQFGREHIPHMGAGFYRFALQHQKFADFAQRKTQFLSAADELDVLQILPAEKPESTFGPASGSNETLFLIEANGIDRQPGLPRHLSDLNSLRHTPYVEDTLWS